MYHRWQGGVLEVEVNGIISHCHVSLAYGHMSQELS